MEYHYTYRITNKVLNKHYYGVRTSKIEPSKDIGHIYFSSSRDKAFKLDQKENPQDYKYKVIRNFDSRKEAMELEVLLHNKFNVGINENFYNKSKQTSTGFYYSNRGLKFTKEHKLKMSISNKNKSKEAREKISKRVSEEWANMSEEKYKQKCKAISESLKGKPQPEWKKQKQSKRMSGASNSTAKHIIIYNKKDEVMFECKGNFKQVCDENKLPHNSLRKSHTNNGERILQTNRSLLMAKKKGWERCEGWYAISQTVEL